MKLVVMMSIAWLAACGKSETPERGVEPEAPPATDPACVAKVEGLAPWIAQVRREQATHETDFGYRLAVIDRAATSRLEQEIDTVLITPGQIEAFDVSEPNRVVETLGKEAAQPAVLARLAAIKAMGTGEELRIDVDEGARWGDVARVHDAAVAAGYRTAMFAFTAKSTLAPPAGVDAVTSTVEAADQADARFDALRETVCPPLDSAMFSALDPDAYGRDIATGLTRCNCAADPDEVRRLIWIDAHWHQARPRVSITIRLGGATATAVEHPAATTWGAALAPLLALAPAGEPPPEVKLVAK